MSTSQPPRARRLQPVYPRAMLHPQSRAALEASATEPSVGGAGFDLHAARERQRALAAEEPREEVAEVCDLDADGVRCRLYRPDQPIGVVLHLHGGGFALNDIDVDRKITRLNS